MVRLTLNLGKNLLFPLDFSYHGCPPIFPYLKLFADALTVLLGVLNFFYTNDLKKILTLKTPHWFLFSVLHFLAAYSNRKSIMNINCFIKQICAQKFPKYFLTLTNSLYRYSDISLFVIALIYSLPSLGYPFGRDQAAHFYVGREWLHGLLPYRDIWDHKPPGIHLIHVLSIAVFGTHQWSIRLMDIIGLLAIGRIVAYIINQGTTRIRGLLGCIWVLAIGLYFTCFDYWDSAQVETWEGLALIGSYAVIVNAPPTLFRAGMSGLLAGVAFVFKFPAAMIGFAIAVFGVMRTWQTVKRHHIANCICFLFVFTGGALIIIGIVGAYFTWQGGIYDMIDLLYGFNAHYLQNKPSSTDSAKLWVSMFWFQDCRVWGSIIFICFNAGIVLAAWRKEMYTVRRIFAGLLFCLCAAGSVWMQNKFYSYHWGVMLPFLVLCAGYGINECLKYFPKIAIAAVIGGLIIGYCYAVPGLNNNVSYQHITVSFWKYVSGYCNRDEYLKSFTGGYDYKYKPQEKIGTIIKSLALPGDQLMVRGFEPAIYAVSGLRSPSRFFIEIPFIDTGLNYKKLLWLEEHERAYLMHPPRFIVTFSQDTRDIKAIVARGYSQVAYEDPFILLERSGERLQE